MFFANLIKILLLFLFIYLVVRIIKTVSFVKKSIKKNVENKTGRSEHVKEKSHDNGNIIELNKDQYKVE